MKHRGWWILGWFVALLIFNVAFHFSQNARVSPVATISIENA